MTNNFEAYKEFIQGNDCPDSYYVIELIRRGKDHPNLPASNYHFRNYYIKSPSDIDKYKDEIILLCTTLGLRAYGSVNYKSFKQVTLNTMAEYAKRIAENNFAKPYNIFESCSGTYCPSNKFWLIDLDECNEHKLALVEEILTVSKPYHSNKVVRVFPTKSGYHLITTAFDRKEFDLVYTGTFNDEKAPEIKTNGITLIYENV